MQESGEGYKRTETEGDWRKGGREQRVGGRRLQESRAGGAVQESRDCEEKGAREHRGRGYKRLGKGVGNGAREQRQGKKVRKGATEQRLGEWRKRAKTGEEGEKGCNRAETRGKMKRVQ